MSKSPENLLYSKDHEWCRIEGDIATIGITHHAQNALGDVVYCELPKAGDQFSASEPFGSVESVKAVSELFAPLSGEVTEVNNALTEGPETVNTDPYGNGWMIKIRIANKSEADALLKAGDYDAFITEESA
jgi:glycine cleavage system H protein